MDKDELKERVAEHLRTLDVGESMSVEDIADSIGEPLSDVNMAVDAMLTERLLFQNGMIGKRTYSLSGKGKHWKAPGKDAEAEDNSEVKDDAPEAPSDGGEASGKEADKPVDVNPEERPEADDPRKCRWCGDRLCTKKYREKHEDKCPKNPKNAKSAKKKGINIPEPALPKKLGNVPAPSECAGGEEPKEMLQDVCDDSYGGQKPEPTEDRSIEAIKEGPPSHEYVPDLPPFTPNGGLCHRCEHSVYELVDNESGATRYECAANCRTEAECKARHKFVERPPLVDPAPAPSDYVPDADDDAYHATPTNPLSATTVDERERLESAPAKTPMATAAEVAEAERILQDLRDNDPDRPDEITAARQDERISMTASPGTCAVLRLLSACQMAVNDGADIMLEAHVTLSKGYTVHIHLDAPTAVKEAPPCLN